VGFEPNACGVKTQAMSLENTPEVRGGKVAIFEKKEL